MLAPIRTPESVLLSFDEHAPIGSKLITNSHFSAHDIKLFFGDDRKLPRTSVTMRDVYDEHKADDGFLYVEYQMQKIGYEKERNGREEMRVLMLQEQLRRARRR